MCSNYFVWLSQQALAEEYGVQVAEQIDQTQLFPYRPTKKGTPAKPYNLAPAIIREPDGERTLHHMRWGLLPHWSKTDQEPIQPFNAQAEGVDTKPMFEQAIQKRRCLVPANAFFEFKTGPTGSKTRYQFSIPDHDHIAFAGLWNLFGDSLYTTTFITTAASEWFSEFHHRQPVTLTKDDFSRWLDPMTPGEELKAMLAPWPGELTAKLEPK